jgi:hypothetical protein
VNVADWGRQSARSQYSLPDDLEALRERYETGDKSIQLGNVIDYLEEMGADSILVESPYVDFDYRSEYSNLYARSFNPPSDKCERLLFYAGKDFLGFLVARPLVKPVGRTAVKPPPSLERFVCCLAPHVARPYGQEELVSAWPFMSQDGVYGRCAHAAIWAIARYHHLRHRSPRYSIAAVAEASGTRASVDKTSVSGGLHLHQVADAFAGLGLPAVSYNPEHLSSGQNLEAVICRYLNSGFPVALNTPNHLTVLTGYGHEGDRLFFIRSDDNREPYERVEHWEEGRDRLKKWEALLVPLPGRIHVPGESAEIQGQLAFLEQAGATAETEPYRDAYRSGEFRIRSYAIEAAEYKKALEDRYPNADVVRHHQRTPAPVWIWVTEFQRRVAKKQRVVAEIAIDATSHPNAPQPVFCNLPGRAVAWLEGEPDPRAKAVDVVDVYDSAMALRLDS